MLNIIANEVYKIFARKKIYIFLIILAVMAVFTGISTLHANNIFGTEGGGQENFLGYVKDNGQNFPLILLDGISGLIVPVFAIILLSDMITDEYGEGTLKLTLLKQVSRVKALFSKVLSLAFILIILYLFVLVLGYIIGMGLLGWGEQFIFKEISLSPIMGIFFTLYIYALSVIPLLAFTAIILIFAVLLSNGGEVIGIGVGVLFLSMVIGQMSQRISPYLVSYYLNLPKLLYSGQGILSILVGVVISAVYGVTAFIISLRIFKKKDILI